ncbi:MAG TPA: SH3 domain-containing protein [Caulobacteraceae bacterium]|nr:SH3 domain-containing protein [Caulobacteraceae bacterium]
MTDSAWNMGRALAAAAVLVVLAACKGHHGGAEPRATPSGLAVPRYVSLKFDEVNARGGPGDDYRLLWVYRAKGLPLQVIEETQEWRRVCDPTGAVAWVKATGVDGRRTVIRLKTDPLPLLDKPAAGSKTDATLAARAVTFLDRCNKDGWCKLKNKRGGGWAPPGELWGTDDARQCR